MKPTTLTILPVLFFMHFGKTQTETVVQFGHIGYAISEMDHG